MTPRDYRPLRRQMLRCDECENGDRAFRWVALAVFGLLAIALLSGALS